MTLDATLDDSVLSLTTKQLLNRSFELDLESFLFEERMIQAMLSTTVDKAEGIAAFREQRLARFEGR
jgi:enoyl-CoA hydratase/carnithine racemase